jgi:DNA-directed RNA polymerase subunit RPC12/RpoP
VWNNSSVQILAKCPTCDAGLPVDAAEAPTAIRCGRCGCEIPLTISEDVGHDARVDACPVCQGREFYTRKDFDPKIGLAIIIIGASASAVFYWFGRDLIAYSLLAAAALVDLVVYRRLEDLTVCYRCHTEFRGAYPRTAAAFDLHTADVLEQEYERRIHRR